MEFRVNDLGFYAIVLAAVLVTAAIALLPFRFVQRVPRSRWPWLPIIHGAWFGLVSMGLYYAAIVGLITGPSLFLLATGYLAARRRISWWHVIGGLVLQVAAMGATLALLIALLMPNGVV